MKKTFFAAIMLASVTNTYAISVEPLPKVISVTRYLVPNCTVTAFGVYNPPTGDPVDVRCTKSADNCDQATLDANRCRDLNVCREVQGRGIEPSPSLNCPAISEIGD